MTILPSSSASSIHLPDGSSSPAVHPETRCAVYHALESGRALNRHQLAKVTGLGYATVRRAAHQLTLEGLLEQYAGRDSDSGRSCELVALARHRTVAIADLSQAAMHMRFLDGALSPLASVSVMTDPRRSPEDNLRLLLRQGHQSIRALRSFRAEADTPIPTALLLVDALGQPPLGEATLFSSLPTERLIHTATEVLGIPPYPVTDYMTALASGLRCFLPLPRQSILYICLCEPRRAHLFMRSPSNAAGCPTAGSPAAGSLYEPACHGGLTERLAAYAAHAHTEKDQMEAVVAFLRDFLAFCRPDALVIEAEDDPTLTERITPLLPANTALTVRPCLPHLPSLVQLGAASLARRRSWGLA